MFIKYEFFKNYKFIKNMLDGYGQQLKLLTLCLSPNFRARQHT